MNENDVSEHTKYTCGFCHNTFESYIELTEHFPICKERKRWLNEHKTVYVHEKISFPTCLKNFGEGLLD